MCPHVSDDVRRLVFTSVDDCRSQLRFPHSRQVLEDALALAQSYGEKTRMKLLQSAIRKYDREVKQELQEEA
jgi:hypothetical protein